MIRLLDQATEDGFVFRVDMRLRPFGDSGPLVASFAFLEDYLQAHGRDWERYAWVKARAITASRPVRRRCTRKCCGPSCTAATWISAYSSRCAR